MDPLGFGLEHFNAIGQWRDHEAALAPPEVEDDADQKTRRRRGRGEQLVIDSSGVMPDGQRRFDGHEELKAHLLADADAMTSGLLKSMLTYVLGRRVGFADGEFVERVHADWKRESFGMRKLIHAIVQTREFQTK